MLMAPYLLQITIVCEAVTPILPVALILITQSNCAQQCAWILRYGNIKFKHNKFNENYCLLYKLFGVSFAYFTMLKIAELQVNMSGQ